MELFKLEVEYQKKLDEYESKKSLMTEASRIRAEKELQELKMRIDELKKRESK